jgi:2-polyprenyl-3-methyl-5-hydroxy-6-metoxy-1,4-benzoquinol methylase
LPDYEGLLPGEKMVSNDDAFSTRKTDQSVFCGKIIGVMDRNYWEKIAPGYDEEIFDVLHNDKKAVISKAIRKISGTDKTVIDAGCAVGKWLPVLSPLYKEVIASDISAKNLSIAAAKYADLTNIIYKRTDLSSPAAKLPKADTVVCINAILTDSLKKRTVFFHNLSKWTKKGGHLVLVIPSLESWMFTRIIQQQFKIDTALFNDKISVKEAAAKYNRALQGNLDIDQVPTKHYLEEELQLLLSREGFTIESCRKIEYNWNTEFVAAPKWLKEPKPWDWFCLARKL